MLLQTTKMLLERYEPADPLEERHRSRMLKLCEVSDAGFQRTHFSPGHFTASAFVLSPDSQELLFILHGKLGLWLQPGGHVEPSDETLRAAAERELLEETGLESVELALESPIDLDVHLIPARKEIPAHEHFDVRFLFRAQSAMHRAQSDALAAKWIPLGDVDSLPTDESVMRAVRKIRRRMAAAPGRPTGWTGR